MFVFLFFEPWFLRGKTDIYFHIVTATPFVVRGRVKGVNRKLPGIFSGRHLYKLPGLPGGTCLPGIVSDDVIGWSSCDVIGGGAVVTSLSTLN